MSASDRTWTREQVLELGVRTDVETAGSIFGLSRTQAYEAVNAERFPVPTFRIGRRMVVPVAPILALLGIEADPAVAERLAVADEPARDDERPGATDATPRKLRALRG